MWHQIAEDNTEEVYLAGEKVLPGLYRQVGSMREVRLETEDCLPASLDGRVACYMRVNHTWAQRTRQHTQRA